jgi:hypothetical protein
MVVFRHIQFPYLFSFGSLLTVTTMSDLKALLKELEKNVPRLRRKRFLGMLKLTNQGFRKIMELA